MKGRTSPRSRSNSPRARAASAQAAAAGGGRRLGCLHFCIALVAVAAGTLLAMGVVERQALEHAGEKDGAPLGSGQMFDAVARHYDAMNKFMSLGMDMGWRRFLVDALELQDGDRVLDLATGTADVAILVAEEFQRKGFAGGRVLGIDPSAGMLALGVDKVAARNLSEVVALELGDAQALAAVAAGSVDKVSMSFGIRNVPDRGAALREMARVLRKRQESTVAILEFQLPRSGPLKYLGEFMVRYGAPAIGALLTGLRDEYVHLRRSILAFPDPPAFAAMMRDAGLDVYDIRETGFGVVTLYLARPSAASIQEAAEAEAAEAAGAASGEQQPQ